MTDADGLPTQRRRLVMVCVMLGVMLGNLDAAIANIALPTIGRELGASDAATVWVVNSYQLAVAVSLLPVAALGEIHTLKRVYGVGLGLFGLASLACAASPTLPLLVAARVVQGTAGACLAALGPALIRAIYPRRLLADGFAWLALVVAVSAAIGPTIAALILSVARWPWLFLVNLPVCLVATPLFWRFAPDGVPVKRAFDATGAALSAVALGLVVVGVDALGGEGLRVAAGEIAAGLLCAVALVVSQRRREKPFVPLDLLGIPLFALSSLASTCSYAAQILAYVSLPFLFQGPMGRSPLVAGFLMTPWPVLVAVAAPLAGRLLKRMDASLLASVGLVTLFVGLTFLALLPAHPGDFSIVWRMGLCGVGFGFFQTPNNTTLMTAGPAERSGAASGMVALARTIGWSLGSALVAMNFSLFGSAGTMTCLATAAGFAAVGALVSASRLTVPRKTRLLSPSGAQPRRRSS